MRTPFLGAAYRARSKNLADQLCINLFPEVVETKTAKNIGGFIAAPGLDLQFDVGVGPIRAMHTSAGVMYVVSGNEVYAVTTSYLITLLGTIPTLAGPCEMIDNGKQILIVDGNLQQVVVDAVQITAAGTGGNDGTYPLPLQAPSSGGAQAIGVFTISGGSITDVTITYGGSNYMTPFTIDNIQLSSVSGVGALVGAALLVTIGGGVAFIVSNGADLASVIVGASGGLSGQPYAPGDVITLAGGTPVRPATVRVVTTQLSQVNIPPSTPGTGVITGFSSTNDGYPYPPNQHVASVGTTGGSGTGATFRYSTNSMGELSHLNLVSGGSSYTMGDSLVVNTSPYVGLTVQVTSVNSAGIISGGTGGTPGPVVVSGTTGSGTFFQINGTINGSGTLASLGAIVDYGNYTVNPANLTNEPITGGGLVGARLSISLGVRSVVIVDSGSYLNTVPTLTQLSTTGIGTGATFSATWETVAADRALNPVSLPFPGASTATYQDGFGLINQLGTNNVWQSNLQDLTTWDALNFSEADADPDNVVAISDALREVWVVKEKHTEIWINAGLNGFAFQRLDGVYIEYGTAAPATLVRRVDSLFWLGQDKDGNNQVLMSEGYKMVVISTPALQYAIDQYERVDDAFAFSYQQEGHSFYFITFPTGNATWVYDIGESRKFGAPMWHQRAAFSNGLLNRHWASCSEFFNEKVLVGDYQNGNVYAFNLDALTDNGAQRKWVRSWRALSQPQFQPREFDSLQIDMQTGVGVPPNSSPHAMLEWSDDGGHRWSDQRIQSVGKTGETYIRVKFNRLGSTRLNSGLDRIFRLSSTDAFAVTLIGAEIEP